jgi:hypothetical protein
MSNLLGYRDVVLIGAGMVLSWKARRDRRLHTGRGIISPAPSHCLQGRKGGMPLGTIILLGAFAGFTIYVGLPLAFLKHLPQSLKVFLNMLATGVLVFLLFDVVSKASDPINAAHNCCNPPTYLLAEE